MSTALLAVILAYLLGSLPLAYIAGRCLKGIDIRERVAFLDRTKNPFFNHSEVVLFLADRDGETVGTIAAIIDDNYIGFHDEKVGFFGLFEVRAKEVYKVFSFKAGAHLNYSSQKSVAFFCFP